MLTQRQVLNPVIVESKNDIFWSDINTLAENVGWGQNYFRTEEQWRYTLQKSMHIAYIRSADGDLIAFGRILEDGQMCMFYDICVHTEHQGEGLGSLLMNHLINKIKDKNYVSIGLFAWERNKSVPQFYSKLGFEESRGMELKGYMRK